MIRKRSDSEDEQKPNPKRLKLEEDEGPSGRAGAVGIKGAKEVNTPDASDASPPGIFKLDVDCCEELFEYLPLNDLHSLGQTCKRLHQYTGCFIRDNYKATKFQLSSGNLIGYCNNKPTKVNGFIEFISILWISSEQMNKYARLATKFKSIKQLRLNLNSRRIDSRSAEMLQRCEEIELVKHGDTFSGDLYEDVLKFCTNLKHLKVILTGLGKLNKKDFDWLFHEYSNLESIDLSEVGVAKVSPKRVKTFFALNKGIRKVSITAEFLLYHQQFLLDSDLKLSELSVTCLRFILAGGSPDHLIDLLNELYERGCYERLSIYDARYFERFENTLERIKAPLTVDDFVQRTQLATIDLIGLDIRYAFDETNFNNIVVDNRIQQIKFSSLNTKHMLHLIQKFKKLTEIHIYRLNGEISLDLSMLNREREKLTGANKVTIYLTRHDYNPRMKMNHCEWVKIKCSG